MSDEKSSSASEEFWDAITNSGSNSIDCGFCGRTHFVDDPSSYYEEGELDELYGGNKADPDKVIFHSHDDSVRWGMLDGRRAVYECPCNSVSRYERLFWNSRYVINEYFTNRARSMQEDAEETSDLAIEVRDAVDP
jgi:hypothetical protein